MRPQPLIAALIALVVLLFAVSAGQAADPERISDLRGEVDLLKRKMDLLQQMVEADRKLLEDSVTLLDRVSRKLDTIERRLDRQPDRSTVLMPDRSTVLMPTRPPLGGQTATIRLDNRLAVPAQVTIDGVNYTVPAFSQSVLANQDVRMITYQVTGAGYGLSLPKATMLRAGETWTLTIY